MSVGFCTLAIGKPYRARALRLCVDLAPHPVVVLTDEPGAFELGHVRAVRHEPTGPMAKDYLERPELLGPGGGTAAYHDKRFAIRETLKDHDTAVFLDADSYVVHVPELKSFPPGLALKPKTKVTIQAHLQKYGPERTPVFMELAHQLLGNSQALAACIWCYETLYAITKDERAEHFFVAWDICVQYMQARGVFSGEGGVMGLAAAYAGWIPNFEVLRAFNVRHEGGGPKK